MVEYEGLPPELESTAQTSKRLAQDRVRAAHTSAVDTRQVVSRVQRAMSNIREMHAKNHYREALLPIFQGSPRG